jgi:hypothetical protein
MILGLRSKMCFCVVHFIFASPIKHSRDSNYILIITIVHSRFSGQFHFRVSPFVPISNICSRQHALIFGLENMITIIYCIREKTDW